MAFANRAADAVRLLTDLVTRDPGFVRGFGLDPSEIPVFTFHSLEPLSFERKMRYVLAAGYRAVSMPQYLDAFFGRVSAPKKSVLITIDDGRATTWTVAYPILKRLGMRATAFLVTSAVHNSDEVSKTVEGADADERRRLIARDHDALRPCVTWGEVRAMRDVIDIESHTHLHARVPVSRETAGVMTPDMQKGYGAFDCPFQWLVPGAAPVRGGDQVALGRALPESAPRLAGWPAYLQAEARYETIEEVREAMLFDLSEARRLIRDKAGVEATTVCYPWHVFSDAAKRAAEEAGYVAGFAGKASRAPAISRNGGDPFEIARVGEDYVERLPGPGRRSLVSVLTEKLGRRS